MSAQASAAWYAALDKPFFAPPSWLFGPVWTVLYIGIAISFGYVFWHIIQKKYDWRIGIPFVFNLIANLAFTPLQFGLRSNELALLDILIVLSTIVWMVQLVWHKERWIAYAQIPYLLWVSFATVLQVSITLLNI